MWNTSMTWQIIRLASSESPPKSKPGKPSRFFLGRPFHLRTKPQGCPPKAISQFLKPRPLQNVDAFSGGATSNAFTVNPIRL
jgi:hypothetical protein